MNTAEYLNTLIECKEDMKAALIDQGAPPTGGLSTYADAIKEIKLIDESVLSPFPVGTKFGWSDFKEFAAVLISPDETDFSDMFSNCENLETIPYIDTSRVTNMGSMFSNCFKLKTIPQLDTSKVEDVRYMFGGCEEIDDIPLLDFSSVKEDMFLFGFPSSKFNKLKNLGGFKDFGKAEGVFGYFHLDLAHLQNLSQISALNVLNNLYDLNLRNKIVKGVVTFNESVFNLLVESDLAIATNKGWTVEYE